MADTGRKPLAAGHVDHLQGSERARLRMKLILQCMQAAITVPEACRQLGICESRFHAMRNQWLQESLQLLEPRRTGRPPKQPQAEELLERLSQLQAENQQLHGQLREALVRQEVAEIYQSTSPSASPPSKKMTRRQRRRARRRPR